MNKKNDEQVKQLAETFERFAKADWRNKKLWGLNASEIRVLLCINDLSGQGSHGAHVSDISKKLHVTSPTVTQMIKSLAAGGYIERTTDPSDRRIADIRLTEKGEAVARKAGERFAAIFSGLIAFLGEERSDTLIGLLTQVHAYFDANVKLPESENN
ncbi:MarR family winged helix-turn-helix transcriptional regulator [Paenibacillus sp. MBLB4367]|uniref:MarR family winged helix-turn-helix transcriptional regulator n=1 Tax=Paenibacillus sp. MBLB4367 TaxID=3384767 RepID=UPI0039081A4E